MYMEKLLLESQWAQTAWINSVVANNYQAI